jgi:Fe2+ or Zn2+ uptake regulation protein
MPSTDQSDLVDLLRARGRRVTSQRLVILRELRRRARHATADEIRRAVSHELPGTAAPTIYATLDLLVELGLVRRIDAGTGASLYDARTEPHQHLVCDRCGSIEDIDVDVDAERFLEAAARAGYTAQRAELVVHGLCPNCKNAR